MPTGVWQLKHSMTNLDAVIAQYPYRAVQGWITFTREQIAPGFVRYSLSQEDLGDRLGTIELRGNDKFVEMCIYAASFLSSRDATDEELADFRLSTDSEERRKKLLQLLNKLDDEHRELARRRREHFENVTSDLIEYINQDWILIFSKPLPQSDEEKIMQSYTSTSVPSSSTFTCFISYSQADDTFAAKLYADLKAHGIKVWRFAEDAKWGETVWGEITEHIQENDKLVVICSENSLTSGPVAREIERALVREDVEHKNILFPIRIDDYIFARDAHGNHLWQHPRRADVLSKIIGDFRGWDTDPAKYAQSFNRLLQGLQAQTK